VTGPLYDPVGRNFFINGRVVNERDDTGLLEAAKSVEAGAAYEAPAGANWVPVNEQYLAERVGKIANPDFLTRAGKSFESAAAGSGELFGAALSFAGLEEPGRAIMGVAQQRQQELSTYNVGLEDIGTDPNVDVLDWTASVIGQLGPSAIESLVAAAVGAVAGGAAGGGPNPFTATAGAIAGFTGKQAFKEAIRVAAGQYAKSLATAEAKGLVKQAAKKEALKTISKEARDTLRTASIFGGGAVGKHQGAGHRGGRGGQCGFNGCVH
jgi:hypothetical protein